MTKVQNSKQYDLVERTLLFAKRVRAAEIEIRFRKLENLYFEIVSDFGFSISNFRSSL